MCTLSCVSLLGLQCFRSMPLSMSTSMFVSVSRIIATSASISISYFQVRLESASILAIVFLTKPCFHLYTQIYICVYVYIYMYKGTYVCMCVHHSVHATVTHEAMWTGPSRGANRCVTQTFLSRVVDALQFLSK